MLVWCPGNTLANCGAANLGRSRLSRVSVEVRREKARGEWRIGFNWAGYGSHDIRYADAMIAVSTQAKTLAEALEQGDFETGDTLALVLE
jgi:hypothetical protein